MLQNTALETSINYWIMRIRIKTFLIPILTFILADAHFADRIIDGAIDAFFSIPVLTVVALVALPAILAASYWLFVVNGPTPVVKARITDLFG